MTTLAESYLAALGAAEGDAAAALFHPDGVLDDLRGGHHAGREEIRQFIGHRQPLTLEILSDVHTSGRHMTVYGQIHYGSGEEANVRWSFTERDGLLEWLVNSRVERLPADRLRSA